MRNLPGVALGLGQRELHARRELAVVRARSPLTHSDTVGAVVPDAGADLEPDDPQADSAAAATDRGRRRKTNAFIYSPSAVAIPSRSASSTTASAPAT